MKIQGEAKLLRIFIGESDKFKSLPIYEIIVNRAREMGLAGATVYKGIMGFGGSSKIHSSKILRLSDDFPLVIEIVDSVDKIEKFIPKLNQIFDEEKTWEIRGSKTNKRGKIGLIQSGSGKIIGKCDLIDCIGPLTKEQLLLNKNKHKSMNIDSIFYKTIFAWVIKNAKRYSVPKSYKHPNGAIIWVKV